MLLTEKKKSNKKDLDFDLHENLIINKELVNKTNKTSSKILIKLFENQINNDSNLIANKNIKLRSSIYISNPKNAIFSNQKTITKSELRRSLSGYFNLQRRVSINNFNSKKPNLNNNKIKNKSKIILNMMIYILKMICLYLSLLLIQMNMKKIFY